MATRRRWTNWFYAPTTILPGSANYSFHDTCMKKVHGLKKYSSASVTDLRLIFVQTPAQIVLEAPFQPVLLTPMEYLVKFNRSCFVAAVLAASAPAFAATTTLTFEGVTSFSSVGDYYLNVGPDFGVQFGLDAIAVSNDGTGTVTPGNPDGNFYSNAPTNGTVMQVVPNGASDVAFLTPRAGLFFVDEVSFYYSTSKSSLDAVQFFSGADGSGVLLGAISLSKNAMLLCNDSPYCNWQRISLTFPGFAQSIMIRSNGGETAFDNFTLSTAVPEPETYAMLLAGLAALGFVAHRQQRR